MLLLHILAWVWAWGSSPGSAALILSSAISAFSFLFKVLLKHECRYLFYLKMLHPSGLNQTRSELLCDSQTKVEGWQVKWKREWRRRREGEWWERLSGMRRQLNSECKDRSGRSCKWWMKEGTAEKWNERTEAGKFLKGLRTAMEDWWCSHSVVYDKKDGWEKRRSRERWMRGVTEVLKVGER